MDQSKAYQFQQVLNISAILLLIIVRLLKQLIFQKNPESSKRYKYENGLLLGKTNPNNEDFDKLILANRNITTTSIPSNIKEISSSAFSECKNLKTMNLLNTKLLSIGESSFCDSSVEAVYIPSSRRIKFAIYWQ